MKENEDEKVIAKNNPTNLKSYNEYLKNERRLSQLVREETRLKRIKKNIQEWTDDLDWPWEQADLIFFRGQVLANFNSFTSGRKMRHFIISGDKSRGKTFLSYAIIKRYMQWGLIVPSEIEIINLSDGIKHILGYYESKDWKNKVFNKKNKLIVIEGLDSKINLYENKKLVQFWQEVIDFCDINEVKVIITYNSEGNYPELTIPKFTASEPFNKYVFSSFKDIETLVVNNDSREKTTKLKPRKDY